MTRGIQIYSNISNFDTKNVKNMIQMFGCKFEYDKNNIGVLSTPQGVKM